MFVITFKTDRKYAAIRKSSDKRITLGVPVFELYGTGHDGRMQCQKIRPNFALMLKWTSVEILSEKEITDKELHDSYLFHDENGNEIPRIEFQHEINSQPDKYKSPWNDEFLGKRKI